MDTPLSALVTAPPYATFLDEVAEHPLVSGFRINTVMPLRDGPGEALDRLGALGQPLWVDLKGRQLRVVGAAIPPWSELRVSHRVQVPTPVDAWLDDGRERARVVAVDGDRLLLEDGPRRLVGPGESVNLVHPALRIQGTLTGGDRAWLAAMGERGLRRVMLSFTEEASDLDEVRDLLPGAEVIAKVESLRGLEFARRHGASRGRLMAARGDLYVEVGAPHRLLGALEHVLRADPRALVASRLFPSLARGPIPEAQDLTDAAFLMRLGYRTFVLGDEVCLRRESVLAALNCLAAVAGELGLPRGGARSRAASRVPAPPSAPGPLSPEELFGKLAEGIRAFAREHGVERVVLGLSGGVDSAVVACLAAEALGPEAVTALAMPSRYSDPRSTSSARELAEGLGIEFRVLPLEPLHAAAEATLGPLRTGVAAENVQARLRMTLLMAEVNDRGGMLLNTSNQTELALGYGTLYGDLAGALSPLGDLPKTRVQELAAFLADRIPAFIRERAPSAELRPDQVDPFDYARVAPAVDGLLRGEEPDLPAAELDDLRERLRRAEPKRRPGPAILRVPGR